MELERDGLIIDMYQLLWQKSDVLSEKYNNFKINLPDTVLFNQNLPVQWYFTNKEGILSRHKRHKITLPAIYSHFLKRASKSSIVAYYLSEQLSEEYLKNNIFRRIKDKNEINSHERYSYNKVCFEYITTDNFHQFLYEKNKERGILQFFVEPYGQFNSMIQVDWGPNICLFSKKANVNKYTDKLDVYEKVATFEGPVFLSRVVPFSSVNQTQYLRTQLQEMVEKVQIISSDLFKIRRMIAFFKIDKNNKTQFLFCTSSRIEKNIKVEKANNLKNYIPLVIQNNLKYPKNVKAIYTINKMDPKKLIQDIKCILCEEPHVYEDLIEVSYQLIIGVHKKLDHNLLLAREQRSHPHHCSKDQDENKLFFKRVEQKNMDNISKQINQPRKKKGSSHKETPLSHNLLIIQKNTEQMIQDSDIQFKYKKDSMQNQQIPFLFRKIHPYLNYQEYQCLEKEENFRQKTTRLCLQCYLGCTQQKLTAGSYPITKPNQKKRIMQQLEENPDYQDIYQNLVATKAQQATTNHQSMRFQQQVIRLNHQVRNQELFTQMVNKSHYSNHILLNNKDINSRRTKSGVGSSETRCTAVASLERNTKGEKQKQNHSQQQQQQQQQQGNKSLKSQILFDLADDYNKKLQEVGDHSQEYFLNIHNKNNSTHTLHHNKTNSLINDNKTKDKIIQQIKQNQQEIKNIDKWLLSKQPKTKNTEQI